MENRNKFKLKILTPDAKVFEDNVESVVCPTDDGVITILKDHSPLVSTISIGELIIKTESGEKRLLVQGGVVDIKDHEVVILADKEIDLENSFADLDEEIKRAEEAMKVQGDEIDFAEEQATIERSLFIKKFRQK